MVITNPNWHEIKKLYDKMNDLFETMALQSELLKDSVIANSLH